jgi:ubiquitin carboxyl-terminal hydrolase L5
MCNPGRRSPVIAFVKSLKFYASREQVLNALGNIPSLPSGEELASLMSFTTGMDPQTRGMAITSSDWLREAHNALSPPSAISLDGLGLPRTTEESYHFVLYVPVLGCLYELDGLREWPVKHGSYEEGPGGWTGKAREVIETRISTYPENAVCPPADRVTSKPAF